MLLKIEKSLRLDTFYEDVPIVLGNGEAFHFHPARFVYYPTVDEEGQVQIALRLNYGPEWEKKFEAVSGADAEQKDIFASICWFADRMLTSNYREEIRKYYDSLLYVNKHDSASIKRMWSIWDLARGWDPKEPISDGSRQPS